MNRTLRLTIATLLAGLFVLIAAGVWAAPKFLGTVPVPPPTAVVTVEPEKERAEGHGDSQSQQGQNQDTQTNDSGQQEQVIDMGTANFVPDCPGGCTVNVENVDPATEAAAPEGKGFFGDAFKVEMIGSGSVKVSFAYPPEFAGKEVTIYKLDTSVNPPVWVAVPGAVVNADGTISVDVTEGGTFSLIGNP